MLVWQFLALTGVRERSSWMMEREKWPGEEERVRRRECLGILEESKNS